MASARSALIVASDDYTDPGLRRLRAPAGDAEALAAVLRDPDIGGFAVQTLLNQPAHEINLAVEEFFADRRPDDLLLLHFSCHGVKDEGGELFFAAANTKLRRLGATAVAADFVNRRMNRSRSRRVVLLLDCCYAGAFERGMTARAGTGMAIEEQFGGRGRAVITASSAMEYAFEGDELADADERSASVFTGALVQGLETGEADRDQDGLVALDELYDYVYDRVQETTPNQTPSKWTFGVQGDLYIARRSRPVTTPAPLPPELQQAVDHPLAAVRAGAVAELERLLESRHAGLALAGRATLERLTDDDSRTVSAAAAAALATRARPATTQPAPLDLEQPAQPAPPRPAPSSTEVEPAPQPPSEPAAAPEPAGPPGGQQGPGVLEPSPAAATQPVVAASPSAPAPAPGGRLRFAAGLAITGSALLVVSLFPSYQYDEPLAVARPGILWYVLTVAVVAAAAGVHMLLPRTRWSIGPGLLLGMVAASTGGFLGLLADPLMQDGFQAAWGIGLAASLLLWGSAGLTGVALAGAAEVHFVRRLPERPLAWLVALLGLAGAVVMAIFANRVWDEGRGWYVAQFVWTAAVALALPGWGTRVVPRQLGTSVLFGWVAGALATAVFHTVVLDRLSEEGSSAVGSGLMVLFGLTLLALLVVVAFLAGTDRGPRPVSAAGRDR